MLREPGSLAVSRCACFRETDVADSRFIFTVFCSSGKLRR